MATPAAKTTAAPAASPVWGTAVASAGNWSSSGNFASTDKAIATKWAAAAGKFACTKGDMTATPPTMTTDCNKLLGVMTGACCATVTSTGPTKPTTDGWSKQVIPIIDAVWPINKGSKTLCATGDSVAKVTGYTAAAANMDGTWGSVDASLKFSGNGKVKRTAVAGSVATWTCSGAAALAASGAAATAFISLM